MATMAISTNTLAHIRFGFGLRPDSRGIDGAQGLLLQLSSSAVLDGALDLDGRTSLLREYQAAARKQRKGEISEDRVKPLRANIGALIRQDFQVELARQVTSKNGFAERLVSFWADHFTVSARGRHLSILRGAFVNEAIRPHISGRFGDMLVASTLHPGMLVYLDQTVSVGPNSRVGKARGGGLNENLAREVLELHTLGVGSVYSQGDVTELAELLTGIRVTGEGMNFFPRYAEPGPETVLGVSYGGDEGDLADIEAALQDLARRPETARHLARKLAVHFVQDEPEEGLVDHIAAAYLASGGDLMATYGALLEHGDAWVPELRKVKQPKDYVVTSLRALGFGGTFLMDLTAKELRQGIANPMTSMGQVPNRPAGPDGWPEEASAWITPATLSARIEWAGELARKFGQDRDPREFLDVALADAASDNTSFLVAGAESKWEGVALVLASPEFNRR